MQLAALDHNHELGLIAVLTVVPLRVQVQQFGWGEEEENNKEEEEK